MKKAVWSSGLENELGAGHPGWGTPSASDLPGDLGQVTQLLWASTSASLKC